MSGLQYCPGIFGIGTGDNTGTLELDGVNIVVYYSTPEESDFDCESLSSLTFSVTDVGGGATYDWTVPAGISITGGQGTASITADGSGISGGATYDICVTTTDACGEYEPCCVSIDSDCEDPCAATTPEIAVTDNDCDAGTDGAFTITTDCTVGNLEWSTDGGATWSSTAPAYTEASVTVSIRCFDTANDCSTAGNAVVSMPEECPCPSENCISQFGEFTITKRRP